ncbi:S-methyl-5'-thioadenosine phosphorylase [Metallumcola ferriviriculae]|uniref:Probable 6-oxopurine nucleoside phosphorylase n=1 Tax=Metallumcola ferriviriculae TaxID=3039180 RepID=A0AAU0UN44_9FIRM|nr:S-methyl-5'-thioadenosine phosphorylase [Desulfitibacteraceae bacterium MK1]
MKIGIIGGTGLYDAGLFQDAEEQRVLTKYGEVKLMAGYAEGNQVVFLNRHGAGHKLPPHLINYRANIAALKETRVDMIIATAAVGSLREDIAPGQLVILDQFIDFTSGRKHTFFNGGADAVVHVDMTQPYCQEVRGTLIEAAHSENLPLVEKGTYICTQGPRFETPAEVAMFARLGGDVVGMTNVPEVVLAREAEICYGAVAVVTNSAAGISDTELTHQEVLDTMAANQAKLKRLLAKSTQMAEKKQCSCTDAVSSQRKLQG